MTLPYERYRAVLAAESLLTDLLSPEKTPRVPKIVRERARMVLRHYPSQWDMDRVYEMRPEGIAENPFKKEWP